RLARPAAGVYGDQALDQAPLLIGQVAGVSLGSHTPFYGLAPPLSDRQLAIIAWIRITEVTPSTQSLRSIGLFGSRASSRLRLHVGAPSAFVQCQSIPETRRPCSPLHVCHQRRCNFARPLRHA